LFHFPYNRNIYKFCITNCSFQKTCQLEDFLLVCSVFDSCSFDWRLSSNISIRIICN
jgi:hypothetical protein